MTGELAFVIRTFFFLLFGFSIDTSVLVSFEVIITGSLIVLGILFMRYLFFKFVTRTNIFPEILIAPRGLISIILFYSIPDELITGKFDEGVLTFVIIVSSVIMMVGILFSKKSFIVEDNFNPVI